MTLSVFFTLCVLTGGSIVFFVYKIYLKHGIVSSFKYSALAFIVITVGFLPTIAVLYRSPVKDIQYMPQAPYPPIIIPFIIPLTPSIVRTKIIALIDPHSALLPGESSAERIIREASELDTHNKRALDCILGTDKSIVEKCKQESRTAREELMHVKARDTMQKKFTFKVLSASKLDNDFDLYFGPLIEGYSRRNFASTDLPLLAYLAQPKEERSNDLWFSEDALNISADNFIEYPAVSITDTLALKKYAITGEYLHNGAPAFGTSDYIIRLATTTGGGTSIDVVALFPRILAGKRYEDGCHAMICPRFVYDLRPVERFDAERIALLNYIALSIKP